MSAESDRFLGTWTVSEFVYAPEGGFCGTVHQRRELFAVSGSDEIRVKQFCEPGRELAGYPMEAFRGEFNFILQKQGRYRHYLGPDVQGYGTLIGDTFLCGEGVWPRFAFNFRSWSVKISETQQLTGGVFFQGARIAAVIFGVGTSEPAPPIAFDPHDTFQAHGGEGSAVRWLPAVDEELRLRCQRSLPHRQDLRKGSQELAQDLLWREHSAAYAGGDERQLPADEDYFQMDQQGLIEIKGAHSGKGMARVYGPLLLWESYGTKGDSTIGLELQSPFAAEQFSLRRRFKHGRLVAVDGLHFSE